MNHPRLLHTLLLCTGLFLAACSAQNAPFPALALPTAQTVLNTPTVPASAGPAPTPIIPTATFLPTPTYPPVALTLRQPPVSLPIGLTLEEYALKSEPSLDPLTFDPVNGSMSAILAMRSAARADSALSTVQQNNTTLQTFGYHLIHEPNGDYTLLKSEKTLASLYAASPISVNQSATDFLMYVANKDGNLYLLRKGSFKEVDPSRHFAAFLGDDLLEAYQSSQSSANESINAVHVTRNGKEIFNLPIKTPSASGDLKGFWVYEGHWALEVTDQIIVDGQSLNQTLNSQATFSFQLIRRKPFFFIQKAGKINASLDGKEIALGYTSIPHNGCCSGTEENPRVYDRLVSFFALRDRTWYYVDLGVFDPE